MFIINGKFTTATIMIDDVEQSCVQQITAMTNHPSFMNPIVIMPDCHAGMGSVIGFTMLLGQSIPPAVVGVDLGCGVRMIRLRTKGTKSLPNIDRSVRSAVPFGEHIHGSATRFKMEEFPWDKVNQMSQNLRTHFNLNAAPPIYNEQWFEQTCSRIEIDLNRAVNSIGTLGGGNHFIDLGVDEKSNHWLTIHSGSRNFGLKVCKYWQEIAKNRLIGLRGAEYQAKVQHIKDTVAPKKIQAALKELRGSLGIDGVVPANMEFLEGDDLAGYLYDMLFAQLYAVQNRARMADIIVGVMDAAAVESFETIHNYIDMTDGIVRKGAVASYKSQRLVIPLNMRDGVLICEGLGNPEWNFSAPHGAGRVMSRHEAKEKLKLQDFQDTMQGIYSTSVVQSTLDEAPDAYKASHVIEEAIGPTAKIIGHIKPVLNMKAMG